MSVTISIITVSFNDLVNLKKTIQSIKENFDSHDLPVIFDHIVIDAKSNDGTDIFLNTLRYNCIKLNCISEPDNGIYDAMNKGVKLSTSDFVVFLNAGDIVDSEFSKFDLLSFFSTELAKPHSAGLVFDTKIIFGKLEFLIHSRSVSRFFQKMPGIHQSMFYKRSVLLSFPFNSKLKICGDYYNFLELLVNNFTFFSHCDKNFCTI